MKTVDLSGGQDLGVQLTLSLELPECRDQAFLPLPVAIQSTNGFALQESKVLAFPSHRVTAPDASLIARILQRTKNFV